jgi:hypothetical protein
MIVRESKSEVICEEKDRTVRRSKSAELAQNGVEELVRARIDGGVNEEYGFLRRAGKGPFGVGWNLEGRKWNGMGAKRANRRWRPGYRIGTASRASRRFRN